MPAALSVDEFPAPETLLLPTFIVSRDHDDIIDPQMAVQDPSRRLLGRPWQPGVGYIQQRLHR
jgi:hypothetical protein